MTVVVNLVRTVPPVRFIKGRPNFLRQNKGTYYLQPNNTLVCPLFLLICYVMQTILRCPKRDLYKHFFWQVTVQPA